MTNFIQDGETLEYTNAGSAIASGDVVVVGKLVGIAATDIAASTGVGTVYLEGVFNVPKNNSLAITQGDQVFWDASPGEVTKTATDYPMGTAHEDAAADATTVNVKLAAGVDSTPQAAVVAAISTADGSDAATTQALANATKTTVNAILTALKNAGLMASA